MDQLIESMKSHLEELEVQFELIDPKMLRHLYKIEEIFRQKFITQEQMNDTIIKNRPSINNIAIESKIARQTIYNNTILKKYIEHRINKYTNQDLGKKVERLLGRIAELEDMVKKMMERDVGVEIMRNKISLLEKELKLSKQENIELHNKYNNLKKSKESTNLSKEVSSSILNVSKIEKRSKVIL
ncbi:hypothetical protein [Paenibacillus ferrarius]|uniref:hypothetical protein n=1 Tax=Paenibacillus ferrarius TaxID=1469647 RepID=UPI003D2E5F75